MIILFGFKSCGKTTLGKRTAGSLDCPFIDLDDVMVHLYDASLTNRQIFQKIGEPAFRALESRALASLSRYKGILSVGGGTVLDENNLSKLKTLGTLVYLETDKVTLAKRIFAEDTPAIFKNRSFEELYEERKPIYESIDAIKLDTSDKTIDQLVTELSRIFHGQ